MRIEAHAKLNLSLAIGPRQDDGYRLLESLMVPLALCDEVTIEPGSAGHGISLIVAGPAAAGVPGDRTNLAWRAVELLAGLVGRAPDVRIDIIKRIPVGGGLAGGSADAAAVLVGLNRLWDLGRSIAQLAACGAPLGSDVPFCVFSEPAWVRGRGEVVEPLSAAGGNQPIPPLWAVLIFPGLALSTRVVYERLDEWRKSGRGTVRRKHRLAGLELFNDLEGPAMEVCPPLARLFQRLERSEGVPRLMVAGSGSTLCAVFDNPSDANLRADRIRVRAECAVAVEAVCAGPPQR